MNDCTCPYVVCPLYGNCAACIAKSRAEGTLANCMERVAAARYGAVLPWKPVRVEVVGDFEAMSRRSAELVAARVREKPDALLCLAAGHTAARTYELLAAAAAVGNVDFSRARFVALDEWLDLDDPAGNCASFMRSRFYGPLGIAEGRVLGFDPRARDPEAECRRVDEALRGEGPIDLFLLGMGMNGHLGLNEPGTRWDRRSIVVELDPVTRSVGQKYFDRAVPLTRGITLGMRYVLESKTVVLQVGGRAKAAMVRRLFDAQPDFSLPASAVKLHPDATLVLDEDAATYLTADERGRAARA